MGRHSEKHDLITTIFDQNAWTQWTCCHRVQASLVTPLLVILSPNKKVNRSGGIAEKAYIVEHSVTDTSTSFYYCRSSCFASSQILSYALYGFFYIRESHS
ncbi:hypothetical protein K469DRAFT_706545 [Zopfia rhizophila CBS 207.26]|uniref:Uncharacterized protein n=1 Tax=Zopfia rhizophila CBS 207.26 TaxID=1314779 RepID=A0A6A6E420_9PEZI|nr:hypothetical protein K469DRAFT_706545 [Zopfia rhizophila CBS 207.26]